MTGSDLYDVVNGLFTPAAAIAQFPRSMAEYMDAYARIDPEDGLFKADPRRDYDWVKLVLTREHELTHFRQINLTGFGNFYFLIVQQQIFAAGKLFRLCCEAEIKPWIVLGEETDNIAARYLTAAQETGALTQKLSLPAIESLIHICRQGSINSGIVADATVVDTSKLAGAYNSLLKIAESMFGDLYSAPILVDVPGTTIDRFSPIEILESHARLTEIKILLDNNTNKELYDYWDLRNNFGKYGRVTKWLLSRVGSPRTAKYLIELALMSPIHPAYSNSFDRPLYLSEIDPGLRLVKLTNAICSKVLPVTNDDVWLDYLANVLPDEAGVPMSSHSLAGDFELLLGKGFAGSGGVGNMHGERRADVADLNNPSDKDAVSEGGIRHIRRLFSPDKLFETLYMSASLIEGERRRGQNILETSNLSPMQTIYSDRIQVTTFHEQAENVDQTRRGPSTDQMMEALISPLSYKVYSSTVMSYVFGRRRPDFTSEFHALHCNLQDILAEDDYLWIKDAINPIAIFIRWTGVDPTILRFADEGAS